MINSSSINSGPINTRPDEKIIQAIENTNLMPEDAKKAIKDYIKDTFNDLWETYRELIEIQPPSEILDYWDVVLQIIHSLIA